MSMVLKRVLGLFAQQGPSWDELRQFKTQLEQAAGPDTAYDPEAWEARRQECPLAEHCNAAAWVVQQRYGGEILMTKMPDGSRHFWNRLPDGREVDLTGDQYGGDGLTPVSPTPGRPAPTWKNVNPRFQTLHDRVGKNEGFNPIREMLDYGEEAGLWHHRQQPNRVRRLTRPPGD